MSDSTSQTAPKTRILFDLSDELTAEEIIQFEASAEAAGAENLTEFFLDLTLRADVPRHAA